jgi:hypothetical protein
LRGDGFVLTAMQRHRVRRDADEIVQWMEGQLDQQFDLIRCNAERG